MTDYKYLSRTFGGTTKMWKGLEKIFDVDKPKCDIPTVKEYLEAHEEVKREVFISKKGNEVLRVYYPNGKIIDYEKSRVDSNKTVCYYYK